MTKLLHLVNPVAVGAGSDLFLAQQVTYTAMEEARRYASARGVDVSFCAVGFPEDARVAPPAFRWLAELKRSALDVSKFQRPRKLPLVADLIQRAVNAADEMDVNTIIYTNVDIAPMPDFYSVIASLLRQGFDAFTICRRTIAKDWPGGVDDLPLMRAQLGESHPGRDCFVFDREAARRFQLGLICTGVTCVGKALAANLLCHGRRYEDFRNLHLTLHLGADQTWMAPELEDYADHNRRELLSILQSLRAAGLGSSHPAWKKLSARLDQSR